MTKSELIERIVTHQGQLSSKDVELAIKTMLEQMSQALATGIVSRFAGLAASPFTIARRVLVAILKLASRSVWTASSCRISNRVKSCGIGLTKTNNHRNVHSLFAGFIFPSCLRNSRIPAKCLVLQGVAQKSGDSLVFISLGLSLCLRYRAGAL